ncbi:MAG: 4-(cytidine 5'-diphospho)-2-C-methyl-D-erythritol kinase [Parachlamydiaceae bacterium]|nr:4-(cytidine 5'-diphospho)-2-C-methyl-D-erythritol kinase [Parachlamydiaceae bacterium]
MLRLASPAKINLFLRILRRRSDGYHELASLFQTIDLCDTLDYSFSHEDRLTCTDTSIPTDRNNLVLKAVDLFRRKTNLDFGVNINLEKRIPVEAGLGGGSSNAATTLWALNQLCNRPAKLEQLIQWSGEIGSDIAFFLSQGTAYCTGRGEILRFLYPLQEKNLCIVKPPYGLSTPLVYRNLDALNLPQRNPETTLSEFIEGQFPCFNDLEIPAFAMMPELASLHSRLKSAGFSEVLMSGSGSAIFCLGEGDLSNFTDVACFQASFINRTNHDWYGLKPKIF